MYDVLGDDDDDLVGDDLALVDDDSDLMGIDDIVGDDILGETAGDDILGDDDDEDMMGLSKKQKIALAAAGVGTAGMAYYLWKRRQKKAKARRSLAARAIMRKRVRNSPVLARRRPSKGREQPLNFYQANVGAGATATVTTRPQTIFRGGRVVLPELAFQGGAFVPNPFVINDIIVGRNSQFVARQQMPAAVFFQGSFGVRVQGDTSQISQDVSFNVTNRAAAVTDFEASIIGEAVE